MFHCLEVTIQGNAPLSRHYELGQVPVEDLNIEADFIDLDKIYSISKFRSGSGHDFSGNGETCRSMKHYFNTQDTRGKMLAYDRGNGIPPKPDGINDINIYSPVSGKIVAVESEQMPIGEQIYIRVQKNF